MGFDGYQPCCHVAALDPEAAFCGTCRRYLIRCMNFADCRSLVSPLDPCPVCLGPELRPARNARLTGGKGARLAIPLVLSNPTSTRPLAVVRVEKREPPAPPVEVSVPFETLEAGREREFIVDVGPFDSAGTRAVELALTLASRAKEGLSETYVFTGALMIDVPDQRDESVNIHIANVSDAGLINISGLERRQRAEAGGGDAAGRVALSRDERREKEAGVRGSGGVMVPRDVGFAFSGFHLVDAPRTARFRPNRMLSFGRVGLSVVGDAQAMDVCLRAYRNNAVDAETSTRVSRHHFDLTVANARLVLLSRSMKGTVVDGERIAAGTSAPLRNGARIVPAADVDGRIGLSVTYATEWGTVTRVDVSREAEGPRWL